MGITLFFYYSLLVKSKSIKDMYWKNIIDLVFIFNNNFSKENFENIVIWNHNTLRSLIIILLGLNFIFMAFYGIKYENTYLCFLLSIFIITFLKYLDIIFPSTIPEIIIYNLDINDIFDNERKLFFIAILLIFILKIINILNLMKLFKLFIIYFIIYTGFTSDLQKTTFLYDIILSSILLLLFYIISKFTSILNNLLLCFIFSLYGSLYLLPLSLLYLCSICSLDQKNAEADLIMFLSNIKNYNFFPYNKLFVFTVAWIVISILGFVFQLFYDYFIDIFYTKQITY